MYAGLTTISLRDYTLASWAGMLPATFAYVYLGGVGALFLLFYFSLTMCNWRRLIRLSICSICGVNPYSHRQEHLKELLTMRTHVTKRVNTILIFDKFLASMCVIVHLQRRACCCRCSGGRAGVHSSTNCLMG
jgi:hypothetical protein